MKLLLTIITIFTFQAQLAFAENEEVINESKITQEAELNLALDQFVYEGTGNKSLLDSWANLGCVRSRHDCRDLADSYHYHHSRANYSHHCSDEGHHTPYSCYARR